MVLAVLGVTACNGRSLRDSPHFTWNGQRSVGAYRIDHLAPDDAGLRRAISRARDDKLVVVVYGHIPGVMSSLDTIDSLLSQADQQDLPLFTFAELAAGGPRRAGIALSFDDDEVDSWFDLRDLLARHHAHVSFFVTNFTTLDANKRHELHVLFDEGNTIEAHGVAHRDAVEYVAAEGLDAFVTNELVPSIDVLRADGFMPVAYAFPKGKHTRAIEDAVTDHIAMTRCTSGRPP